MRVRAFSKNIDDVVATIKAATIKNNGRKNDVCETGLPSPLVLVGQPIVLVCQHNGQLGLELHYITAKIFLLFVPLPTIGQLKVS